ncbi:RHS domain-containing protein [Ottowia cancrivicina]|uniref:RHS domain-containing protein n=1 Tax=Ottowia cancrivicina TaxID=3040346 RepID=UPI003D1843C1
MTKAYGFNSVAAQQGLWSTDPVWQVETPGGSLTDPKARYDWLHTDHLGTPILATTKEGQTSWKAIAESFGATQISMVWRRDGCYGSCTFWGLI